MTAQFHIRITNKEHEHDQEHEKSNPMKSITILGDLIQSRKITPVIDRTYKLSEVAPALRYLEEGLARGKVVITAE
jgi:NADPH:quinone reductase-like Zn-dependent oxidoreductase